MAIEKLSALFCAKNTKPGRFSDGGGLYLQVRNADQKSWLFRYKVAGKSRSMGLGSFIDLTLAEAREACRLARKSLKIDGVDPLEKRRAARAEAAAAKQAAEPAMTFKQAAEFYIRAHEATWKSDKHRGQWPASLGTYCYPVIGAKSVAVIDTGDITRVLEPIWLEKPETATRVRGRIETVLDYSRTRGWCVGENPARWRGHLEHILPKRGQVARIEHHPALPWPEVGSFMVALTAEAGIGALALRWTILTAARTSEALGSRWNEIDFETKTWTVPAARMKGAIEHRIPLTEPALNVLQALLPMKGADDALIFPGSKPGRELSNMSMTAVLRRMKRDDLTVHGFRSTFRDWAAETTGYPRELAEAALAHVIGSKVEAAYRRGDLFEKRRRLMDDWSTYCTTPAKPEGANVVPLRAAAGE